MTSKRGATRGRERVLLESDAPSWDRFGGKLDPLPELAAEYITIAQQMKELEARKREIREAAEGLIALVKEDKVRGDFFLVNRFKTRTPTKVDEMRLLDHGVAMDVIEDCRVGGDEYWITKIEAIGI